MARTFGAAGLALALALSGCGLAPKQAEGPADPPADPGIATYLRGGPPREPIAAPTRPDVYASITVDYAALPFAAAPEGTARSIAFRLAQAGAQCTVVSTEGIAGAVTLGARRLSVVPASTDKRASDCTTPPDNIGGTVEGLRIGTWEDEAVDFVSARIVSSRTGITEEKRTEVRASALVPKVLYAFRAPLPGADPAAGERLVLVGPRALWRVAAAPGRFPPEAATERFSKMALDVRRGATASALLTYPWRGVFELLALRDPEHAFVIDPRMSDTLTVAVEVAWPSADPAPSVTVFVEHSHPYEGPPPKNGVLDIDDFVLYE